jgi:hypothetical protein
MKIIYPLKKQDSYLELKFSLRSLEMFYPEHGEVIIVGDEIPDWLTGVTQLCVADVPGRKQLSIRKKILAACEYCNKFLFMNDDVYLLNGDAFPYRWHGTLKKYSESGTRQVEKKLIELNLPTKLFDGHYPLIYDAVVFMNVSRYFHPDSIIKSMYCNFLNIEGEFGLDCKLLKAMKPDEIYKFIEDKPCFSTGALSLQSAIPVLEKLFPNKSKYEV